MKYVDMNKDEFKKYNKKIHDLSKLICYDLY